MKKYKVLENCITYNRLGARKKYWNKGDIVEIEGDEDPGRLFQLVSGSVKQEEVDVSKTYKSLQDEQKAAANPKTGFASSLNAIEPEVNVNKKKK